MKETEDSTAAGPCNRLLHKVVVSTNFIEKMKSEVRLARIEDQSGILRRPSIPGRGTARAKTMPRMSERELTSRSRQYPPEGLVL